MNKTRRTHRGGKFFGLLSNKNKTKKSNTIQFTNNPIKVQQNKRREQEKKKKELEQFAKNLEQLFGGRRTKKHSRKFIYKK